MMFKKVGMVILMLVLCVGLAACGPISDLADRFLGGNQDLSDHVLVGTWNWDDNALWQYTFNEDGSGTRGLPDDMDTFTWSIPDDGHLRMNVRGGIMEHWNYTITGDALTLESRQVAGMTYHYMREGALPPMNAALFGLWLWDDHVLWQYTFNQDGTGTRGLPDDIETFVWSTPNAGHLRIEVPAVFREEWNYTVDGDSLILDSRQFAGMTHRYSREGAQAAAPSINPALIGTWSWDDDPLWQYDFLADGTGLRGREGSPALFDWSTPEPGVLWIETPLPEDALDHDLDEDALALIREEWNYTIDGDSLILDSRQLAGMTYSYTRVN